MIFLIQLQGCGGTNNSVPPNAVFTASTYIGSFPLFVIFDAGASSDSDGRITRYSWQFGDGATGTGSTVQHAYSSTGTYRAQLTVTDNDGNTGTYSRDIEVKPRYELSGTVTSAEYLETDSDLNDPLAFYASNDSFDDAQEASAPNSISGYVNLAFSGSLGRSYSSGDPEDYYLVNLSRDMDITLHMTADTASSELELYLYDDQRNLIDATQTDSNGLASLIVPEDGLYFLRIVAADYASLTTSSLYLLNMGKSDIATRLHSLRLSDDFVPGEVLVRFDDTAAASLSGMGSGINPLAALGLYTDAKTSARGKLWKWSGALDKNIVFERFGIQPALSVSLASGYALPDTVSKLETLWMIRALKRIEGIRIAEPNYIRRYLAIEPNDTYYSYQWHYPLIGLPEAWEVTTGSRDVIVAVMDSGILGQHPDLAGQIVGGYDFVSDDVRSLDGDGVDPDPQDPGDGGIGGSSFHGTHTAGTIAALSNNGNGVAGVAWNAGIMPLRVIGSGGTGTTNDIIEAVRYAAGLETDAGVQLDDPVDIINLSLGGAGYSQIEEEVYQEVRDQGVIIIASAGNDGNSIIMYPAGYNNVVSVSAVDLNGEIAGYSSFGTTIDVAAPGGSSTDINRDGYVDGVLSTIGDDSSGTVQLGYAFYTGTSMAAPHVSGVAALMKAVYPSMTPEEFDALLSAGYLTQSNSDSGWDSMYGYGLIDAYKAVLVAREGGLNGGIPAILSVAPRSLNFGRLLTSLDVTVENGGDGTLELESYSSDVSWISIAPSNDVDENGLGTYIVGANRDGLDDGVYTANLTFQSGTQQVRVSAVMQVGLSVGNVSGGFHYILLLNADTRETLAQYSSSGQNRIYEYNFTGLFYDRPYLVYAGTDSDNNGFICGNGETCGAYLSIDQPVLLKIREDTQGIDFSTDINISIPDPSSEQLFESGTSIQRSVSRKIPE